MIDRKLLNDIKKLSDGETVIISFVGVDFRELSPELQEQCLDDLLSGYDINGYLWHENAEEEEYFLAETLKEKGFINPGVVSTQSFCVQGDFTRISFEGLDVDKFLKTYDKEYKITECKHAKKLLEKILYFEQKEDRQEIPYFYYTVDGLNAYIWEDWYSKQYPRLTKAATSIAEKIESIVDLLNTEMYNAMEKAYNEHYSKEHMKERIEENDYKVIYKEGEFSLQ